jgi:uncharacterized protein YutE (UPF0331/DUF86 family)
MTPSALSTRVVTARLAWVRDMLARLRALPLDTFDSFSADPRTAAAAESYLRRALEALLDLGRHLLAKGFAVSATEYKEVAFRLGAAGVLEPEPAAILATLARYRNRLVRFYDEVAARELCEICSTELPDIELVANAIAAWVKQHPEYLEGGPRSA